MPAIVRDDPGVGVIHRPPRWAWDRWYSRNPLSAFATGQSARAVSQLELARLLAREHARHPYDVLYQFSQIELFGIRSRRSALPPIVLHPEVHAAGELAWHRREDHLAARGETRSKRLAARAVLTARTFSQRRDIALARRVIAPSRVFASHLARDYRFPRERISVVPNPIDLERFAPAPANSANGPRAPVRVLFVSRLAVRKGVELVTALSHRLSDLAGDVRIEVIGNHSLWSDYRALLEDLHPAIASYEGALENARLAEAYRAADLVIQPSHYEPFALTVGEALASGVPIVASSEVGATEGVNRACCVVFAAGDLDAFEGAVRGLVHRIRQGEGPALARLARADAQRLFSVDGVSEGIMRSLDEAIRDRDGR
jgi:glycosyltransferase involved in cell wall biosynthesis